MRISTKGQYAIQMLLDLAEHQNCGYIALKDNSRRRNISKKYLEQIVCTFTKANIVKTTRGYQGGYQLVGNPDKYTLGEILRLTEGSLSVAFHSDNDTDNCGSHGVFYMDSIWKGLNSVINEYLDGITLKATPHKLLAKGRKKWYNKDMNKQISLSMLNDELLQVRTKKKEFLEQIERIVPWDEWAALIKPCYYKGERGNKPYDLELMLRIYLLQNLYDLADEATVAEVIDSRAFSDFCGVDSSNQVPDGDTLGRFRNILVNNGLQEELFTQVVELLKKKGLILKKGTIVDSTIISAPSSTKNKEKKRDPDAHSVKKGNQWHFGYKAHIGVDKGSGLVHHIKATAANVHDVTMTSQLLYGEENEVYGDSGYTGADKRGDAIIRNKNGRKIKYKINRKPTQIKKLSASGQYAAKKSEHKKSSVRAKVEHSFAVVKRQLGFRRTRYRGLKKQTAKINIMFALANLILADRISLPA